MRAIQWKRTARNFLLLLGILGAAVLVSMGLAEVNDDNNPFAMAVFILAVALVARVTDGYGWGIAASVLGTFFVNYIFTYPFWAFDVTYPGYPLTMTVMLVVSLLISALTTQIKWQEQLRFDMEREKMRANLLRAIAHDIRTPLAAIIGASTALEAKGLPPEDREALLHGIRRDAEWLVRVTENLLSVTRVTGGAVELKKEDEVLEEIIGGAIVKYRRAPDALPVHVEAPEDMILAPMDGTLMEQVLLNLLHNVSAHAKGATGVWLRVTREGREKVTISVEDDGCGIPPAQLRHLFDGSAPHPESRRPDDRKSMGIGLSVCTSVINAHGGQLTAGRSDHGGAAFRFSLPCKEESHVG